jgi:hypothetical protein
VRGRNTHLLQHPLDYIELVPSHDDLLPLVERAQCSELGGDAGAEAGKRRQRGLRRKEGRDNKREKKREEEMGREGKEPREAAARPE